MRLQFPPVIKSELNGIFKIYNKFNLFYFCSSVNGVFGLNEENLTKMLFNENLNLFPPYFQYENPSAAATSSLQTPSNPTENTLLHIQKRNSSADLTPASSEFEFCTNDATKGSDEDDEDQTISEVFPSFESFPSLDRDFSSKSTNISMDTQDSKESPPGEETGLQVCYTLFSFLEIPITILL